MKQVNEAEEIDRIVLANVSDTVFVTTDQGDFTYVCPNVATLFGYSRLEVIDLGHISALLGNGFFSQSHLAAVGEIKNIERKVTDKNGELRTLLVNVKQVSIQNGTMLLPVAMSPNGSKQKMNWRIIASIWSRWLRCVHAVLCRQMRNCSRRLSTGNG